MGEAAFINDNYTDDSMMFKIGGLVVLWFSTPSPFGEGRGEASP
jgi:hypothetical protein